MRPPRALRWLLLLLATATAAAAAPAPDTGQLEHGLAALADRLGTVEYELGAAWLSRRQLSGLRARVKSSLDRALELREAAQEQLSYHRELLQALGPPPADGEPPEAPQVAAERRRIQSRMAPWQGFAKKANVLQVKATELLDRISGRTNAFAASALLERRPPVWTRAVWSGAAQELREALSTPRRLRAGHLVLALVLATLWGVRRWLAAAARNPGPAAHSVPRLTARACVPVIAGAAVGLAAQRLLDAGGTLLDLLVPLLQAGFAYLLMCELATLLPAPRPAPSPTGAAAPPRPLALSAGVAALSLLILGAGRRLTIDPDLLQVSQLVLRAVLAAALAATVLRLRAVQRPQSGPAVNRATRAYALRRRRRSPGQRSGLAVLALLALFATANAALLAAGYAAYADWLFRGLLGSGAVLACARLLSALLSEAADRLIRRWVRPAVIVWRQRPLTRRTSRLLHVCGMALVNLILLAAVAYGMMRVWDVDATGLTLWFYRLVGGIEVGGIEISVFDVVGALLVLIAALAVTRLLQRMLTQRVLPHTRLDPGAQTALRSGVGYLGLVAALLLSITTLGVDLSDLALVAGGLAVGVGFGLQHVANNVISGLIMLAERPVKPGDWIVVDGHEGLVRRISLRATELKTFQRASVFVPNSELVSGTVTNWTFKDAGGRLEVEVTIDDGADDGTVVRVLEQCAREHPAVLDTPEPRALLREFAASGLRYTLWAWVANMHPRPEIESELRRAILARLREAGIALAAWPAPAPLPPRRRQAAS